MGVLRLRKILAQGQNGLRQFQKARAPSLAAWRECLNSGCATIRNRLLALRMIPEAQVYLKFILQQAKKVNPPQALAEKALLRARQSRELASRAAAHLGRIASAGVKSPVARLGTRTTAKLAAAALGITVMTGFVPFALDVAGQNSPSELASEGASKNTGSQASNAARLRKEPATSHPSLSDPAATSSTQAWSKVVKPIAIFGVSSLELASITPRYEALRNGEGGRDDRLVFGEFASSSTEPSVAIAAAKTLGPHIYLSLMRMTQAANSPIVSRSFYVDLVHQTANLGLVVERAQQPAPITTKFGVFEVADAAIMHGQTHRACLAFRFVSDSRPFKISGWWCAAGGKPADRRQLACMLDRVDLLSAGEDRELRILFTTAEKARDPGCLSPRMANIGRKTSWLDADAQAPALRGTPARKMSSTDG